LSEIAPRLGPASSPPQAQPVAAAATAKPAAAAPAAAKPPPAPAQAAPAAQPEPAAELQPPRAGRLVDFLRPGELPGADRLRGAEPPLVVDPNARSFIGGSALKPLLGLAAQEIAAERWEAVTPHEYERQKAELGEQPLGRLQWLAGLGA